MSTTRVICTEHAAVCLCSLEAAEALSLSLTHTHSHPGGCLVWTRGVAAAMLSQEVFESISDYVRSRGSSCVGVCISVTAYNFQVMGVPLFIEHEKVRCSGGGGRRRRTTAPVVVVVVVMMMMMMLVH